MDIQEQTSLKALFQSMTPESMSVVRGEVISASPLKIQIINDEKMVLHENIICLPRHLTDYSTKCDIVLGEGSVNSQTQLGGAHPHGSSGTHSGHTGGDGAHSHPSSEGAHTHTLETFNVYGASIKIYNALKVGEIVFILSFNQGKKYYILDREV